MKPVVKLVSVSIAGTVDRGVCICLWYSMWPCPASLLRHDTSARADLVRFLAFAAFWVEKFSESSLLSKLEVGRPQSLEICGVFKGCCVLLWFGLGFFPPGSWWCRSYRKQVVCILNWASKAILFLTDVSSSKVPIFYHPVLFQKSLSFTKLQVPKCVSLPGLHWVRKWINSWLSWSIQVVLIQ